MDTLEDFVSGGVEDEEAASPGPASVMPKPEFNTVQVSSQHDAFILGRVFIVRLGARYLKKFFVHFHITSLIPYNVRGHNGDRVSSFETHFIF